MKSIKLHFHIGLDGVLRLQVPEDLKDMDITVTIQSADLAISTSGSGAAKQLLSLYHCPKIETEGLTACFVLSKENQS